jgi:bidirectional [NiFe] hydrogenase diaphorase subunit
MCLVEVGDPPRLMPACTTQVFEEMNVQTSSDRLRNFRRMIIELLFAERNHVCGVCVANGNCELQDLAVQVGMDHVRFDYLYPKLPVDISHERFGIDHNRCILCTRCVRVCDQIEGAHTWDVAYRGVNARVITDMHQPWGTSPTCTSCG